MSLDLEPRTRPLPELDLEQEVDFGRYVRIVLARWWLLVVGVIIGALIGLAVATSKSRPYEATALVYLGQPYLPGGGGAQIQSLNTKLAFVSELIVARSTLATVSAKTGIKPGFIQSRVSVEPVTGINRGKVAQPAPIVAVTVHKLPPKEAAAVANAEGDVLARNFSSYVNQKMSTYQVRLKRIDGRITQAQQIIAKAQKDEAALVSNHSVGVDEKLALLAHYDNIINNWTVRLNQLEADQISSGDVITLADQIEKARVLEPAKVHRAAAPSRRTSVLIGGFVGLLVALIGALLWDPVLRRVRSQPRPA
jgi:capsular polysaccharide biosynthesis protein